MSDLIPFDFNSKKLRYDGTWDAPEFHVADLCALLEYKNPREALAKHVDPKDVTKRDTLSKGGKQTTNYVTEAGMWSLVLRANTPAAKPVQRWVTSEVLPAIRKTGRYDFAQQKIAALLGEHIRPWVALFPQEYWANLDRIYGIRRPDPDRRPLFYAGCVRLVYETFDPDIHAAMRGRVPEPQKHGVKQHQALSDLGRECMHRHIARHLGLLDASTSSDEYRALVRQVFGRQLQLSLKGTRKMVASEKSAA